MSTKIRTWIVAVMTGLVAAVGPSGCATMAHSVNPGGLHMRKTDKCDGLGEVCPWFAADFAWLFAGIVPGVVALCVDFGTGAWKHANLPETTAVAPGSETAARVYGFPSRAGECAFEVTEVK